MTTRDHIPTGEPCWLDLWTSDVEGSRRFYGELFGWEPQTPSPEFGGYFMFHRDGVPVAGGMGDMGELRADDTWKVFFTTDDVEATLKHATASGAEPSFPVMPVADLGVQSVMTDPTGAVLGVWQPGTFQGFTVIGEPGTPSWFELHTRDYEAALAFYSSTFGWQHTVLSDTDEFRYATVRAPGEGVDFAGLYDARSSLPEGAGSRWSIYWKVDDVDTAAAKVRQLGGSVVSDPTDSPYGRMATVTDSAGAEFKLHTPNR